LGSRLLCGLGLKRESSKKDAARTKINNESDDHVMNGVINFLMYVCISSLNLKKKDQVERLCKKREIYEKYGE